MAIRTKRDLFGGALRCAGLLSAAAVTAGASAGLSPMSQYAQIFAYPNSGSYVYMTEYTFGAPGNLTASYAGLHASAYWDWTQNLTGASVTNFDPGLWDWVGVHVAHQFWVMDMRQVRLEWNLEGASGGNIKTTSYSGSFFLEFTNSDLAANPVGSTVLTLEAGDFYNFIINLGVNGGQTGSGYIRFVEVPAPGAIALLGISMFGSRRKRRE